MRKKIRLSRGPWGALLTLLNMGKSLEEAQVTAMPWAKHLQVFSQPGQPVPHGARWWEPGDILCGPSAVQSLVGTRYREVSAGLETRQGAGREQGTGRRVQEGRGEARGQGGHRRTKEVGMGGGTEEVGEGRRERGHLETRRRGQGWGRRKVGRGAEGADAGRGHRAWEWGAGSGRGWRLGPRAVLRGAAWTGQIARGRDGAASRLSRRRLSCAAETWRSVIGF